VHSLRGAKNVMTFEITCIPSNWILERETGAGVRRVPQVFRARVMVRQTGDVIAMSPRSSSKEADRPHRSNTLTEVIRDTGLRLQPVLKYSA